MNSFLGARGESMFSLLVTDLHSEGAPIFAPEFLGNAWPVVDYIVRLRGNTDGLAPYFFVQVKTTRRGYTRSGRLRASISAREMNGLASNPVPTYIVGVDERERVAYLVSANGEQRTGLSSLPMDFPLDHPTQKALWDEVLTFWKTVAPARFVSRFSDPDRRVG